MLQITLLILHNEGNSIHIYIGKLIRREVFYIWSHVSTNVQETDSAECVWANLMHSKPCEVGSRGTRVTLETMKTEANFRHCIICGKINGETFPMVAAGAATGRLIIIITVHTMNGSVPCLFPYSISFIAADGFTKAVILSLACQPS